ncbi:hypothetical protein [Geomicrobium sp. JCM 19039]|uniref:hypothetical protein n=1 Tax=Geomicrobium sp. JCM 19039 TaxID=1460636 RepID=UPI00045F2A02|nr:hypothetical protein [Geomicrobium sp. JCM 19039]GAK12442.1 hypothetical protein JCM19039_2216 [Geomicrobium sp. JCM 19039]
MMYMMYIISIIIAAYGMGVYISFSVAEGKDERGRAILAKAGQHAFSLIYLGFALFLLYFEFMSPSAEEIRITALIWFSVVFIVKGISIQIYQKKM